LITPNQLVLHCDDFHRIFKPYLVSYAIMSPSLTTPPILDNAAALHIVRNSKIHGYGVFAARKIPEGTCIIEYIGERVTAEVAADRGSYNPDNPYHTFFFSVEGGLMIDGGVNGNDARWINHACEPNCEAREEDGRVFIYALRDIRKGEELNYDYGLVIEERHTQRIKNAYGCRCGKRACRSTMLAPKRRRR